MNNLRELAQSKLIILYLINKVNMPITNIKITNILLELKLMNYFSMQEYISELLASNLIKSLNNDEKVSYVITNEGRLMLEYFDNKIPHGIMSRIDEKLGILTSRIKEENETVATWKEVDVETYKVTLAILERGEKLFQIELIVGNEKEAKNMCRKFKKNKENVYSTILKSLT